MIDYEQMSINDFLPSEEKIIPQADYTVYTDGGCEYNPGGKGGYGVVIIDNKTGETEELYGGFKSTTNNRMEIMAAIKACAKLPVNCTAILYSDSSYVVKTMNGKFKRKNNNDFWAQLDASLVDKVVDFQWVKGHAENKYNERCDELATRGYKLCATETDPGYHGDAPSKWLLARTGAMDVDIDVEDTPLPIITDVDAFAEAHGIKTSLAEQLKSFYEKKNRSFGAYNKLKVGGQDKISRKTFDDILEAVGDDAYDDAMYILEDEDEAIKAMKWHLRGLTLRDAIRKVLVEREISAKTIHGRKKRGE